MLRSRLSKAGAQITHQLRNSPSTRIARVLPVYANGFLRQVSTGNYTRDSKSSMKGNEPEAQKFGRRYVEVDTEFSRANKYTYAMPDDPYVASDRVTKILELGTVDDAADYIKALPMYLQSPVVWNQLIGHCAKHGRANYAEQYFSQMRKRGIEPNDRTFTHMLVAYSKSASPQAISRAEAWIKRMKDFGIKPAPIHFNNLMRVYNNANQPERTLELLKQLSTSGEAVPDAVTYTIALQACPQLSLRDPAQEVRSIWKDILHRISKRPMSNASSSASSHSSLLAKKASNIVWTESAIQQNKTRETELELDDSLIVALISSVTQTAATERDVLTGIEAIDVLYSLCPPRAAEIMKNNGIIVDQRQPGFGFQPSVKVLDAILRFSGGLREFKLGKEYFDLALQQFPRIEPDKYVTDAYSWIEKQLKRQTNLDNKKQRSRKSQRSSNH